MECTCTASRDESTRYVEELVEMKSGVRYRNGQMLNNFSGITLGGVVDYVSTPIAK